jgi:hypothetical protein
MQTLDNLLTNGKITIVQYLERIPDSYMPGRRALIAELKQQEAMQQAQMQAMSMQAQPPAGGEEEAIMGGYGQEPEITGGRGYGAMQRAINNGEA